MFRIFVAGTFAFFLLFSRIVSIFFVKLLTAEVVSTFKVPLRSFFRLKPFLLTSEAVDIGIFLSSGIASSKILFSYSFPDLGRGAFLHNRKDVS